MGINSSSDTKEEAKDEKLSLLERMKENRRTKAEVRDANVTCSRGIKKHSRYGMAGFFCLWASGVKLGGTVIRRKNPDFFLQLYI